jgi:NAD(P)-dependent dehydrogenase (short-subunit alcohol dehydrogenase family)
LAAKPTVLINGASGAYAAYMAESFKAAGYETIGVSRQSALPPERFDHHVQADVSDDSSIEIIAAGVKRIGCRISVLVANAGQRSPTDHLANLSGAELLDLFNVHGVSLVRTLQAVWDNRVAPLKLVAITSRFASFGLHDEGVFSNYRPLYSYSVAKVALNMICMRLRAEYPREALGIYLVHPGRLTVGVRATDACDDPAESAERLVRYVEETEGCDVVLYDLLAGKTIPW